jgi:putative tryptophan/tyrosine transport system substrate-binding protein
MTADEVVEMKRREFVTLIGGAAAWPIAAWAQRSGAMRRVVVVGALAPDDVEIVKRRAAFEQALAALGWTKGGTIAIDYHWIANDTALAQKTAVEVVALAPDVLLASSNIVIEQLSKATGSIPIVMVQTVDPVGSGYIESMARPGGNITGFTQFEYSLAGKWLDLLMEIAPRTSRVAVLRDPTRGPGIGQFAVIQAMAPARGIEPIPINTLDVADMERRITAFASVPYGGVIATVTGGATRPRGDDCRSQQEPLAVDFSLSILRR